MASIAMTVLRPLCLLAFLVACTAPGDTGGTNPVIGLTLSNAGAHPLHCRLMFGHWVERDLGVLEPGASVSLEMRQQPDDGALYVMRPDGRRRMMIENIICGLDTAWQQTFAQVDLMPVRAKRPAVVGASCAATGDAGARVSCPPVSIDP